jgi:hypothetical protein
MWWKHVPKTMNAYIVTDVNDIYKRFIYKFMEMKWEKVWHGSLQIISWKPLSKASWKSQK